MTATNSTKHGYASRGAKRHPLYRIWADIKKRCSNPRCAIYAYYGGRGIGLCDQWLDPSVFIEWALRNGWEPGLTVERNNVDRDYEPGNCRLATRFEQARNKRNTVWIVLEGRRLCLKDAVSALGIVPYKTAHLRISRYGWDVMVAITTPVRERRPFRMHANTHGSLGPATDVISC